MDPAGRNVADATILDVATKWAKDHGQTIPELCQDILDLHFRKGPDPRCISVEQVKKNGQRFLVCYLPQINGSQVNRQMWLDLLSVIKNDLLTTRYFGEMPTWHEPNQIWCNATDPRYWNLTSPNWDVDFIKSLVERRTSGIYIRRLSGQPIGCVVYS